MCEKLSRSGDQKLKINQRRPKPRKKVSRHIKVIYLVPQTPPVSIHFGGLNIGKMAGNQKIALFLRFQCISLFNFAENVMSRSLEIILIMNLMKYCDNGSPSRSKFTLKTRFLVILGHVAPRMVSHCYNISSNSC